MEITLDDIKDILLTMKNRTANKKQIAFLLDCSEREVGKVIRRCPPFEIAEGSYGYFYWGMRFPEELNIEERKILLAHINGWLRIRRREEVYHLVAKEYTEEIGPSRHKTELAECDRRTEESLDETKELMMGLTKLRNNLMANLNSE